MKVNAKCSVKGWTCQKDDPTNLSAFAKWLKTNRLSHISKAKHLSVWASELTTARWRWAASSSRRRRQVSSRSCPDLPAHTAPGHTAPGYWQQAAPAAAAAVSAASSPTSRAFQRACTSWLRHVTGWDVICGTAVRRCLAVATVLNGADPCNVSTVRDRSLTVEFR